MLKVSVNDSGTSTGTVQFSSLLIKELCEDAAFDAAGPVPVADATRFLASLPGSISGSVIRARMA